MTYNVATTAANSFQWIIALSNESAPLTTGTGIVTLRAPRAMTLQSVKMSCTTAPTGAAIQVDILYLGSTIFSTKPTIAASATTSVGGTASVLSTTFIPADGQLSFSITQIGSTVAGSGLKVTLSAV